MDITTKRLKEIIMEELQEEIELQELYFPFFGGKLPEEEVVIRRKQLQAIVDAANELDGEAEARFKDYYSRSLASEEEADSPFLGNQIEAGMLGQQLQVLRKLMRKRHKKQEAQTAMNIFDQTADHISKQLGGIPAEIAAEKAAESKRKEQVARDKAEREREIDRGAEEERRQGYIDHSTGAFGAGSGLKKSRSGSSQSHRVNPGFAGSGNMGYGESIDRNGKSIGDHKMNITKKRLKEIIHEEIEEATKGSLSGAAAQLDREAGVELSPEQKKQLAYLLGKRGKQFSPDPVKRNRQINYWIDLIKKRGEKNLDVTPSYIDDEDDMKAIGENIISVLTLMKEGVVDMDGETIVTGPDGDASPLARAGARQDDLQTTMMKAAMEIQKNQPQKAYETLLRALAAAGIEDEERLPGLGDELNEMYAGYSRSRGGARGSSYSGFPPADARKLAMRLAAMSRNRSLSYGDEKALNAYVGKQKYSTSREAKEDIIKYLVGQRFGNRADYR